MRVTGRQEGKINTEKRVARRGVNSARKGRLYIIGIGPGAGEYLSIRAHNAILESEVVVGYHVYIKLLKKLLSGKEAIFSGMTQETARVKAAIRKALEGKTVSLVSSGDPGVYGMAGLALELLTNKDRAKLDIEIIPGIMAATAAASRLGAPLSHDFAVISLSDLLTDGKKIEERLRMAAKADFVIVLYNPKSRKRQKLLEKSWRIIAEYRSPGTPVGIVKNASRNGEKITLLCLGDAPSYKDIDMVTTIIIGNQGTFIKNGFMVTPRGYKLEKGAV